jgi:photosystem II stability/assembly factor-like uncharacterized protein
MKRILFAFFVGALFVGSSQQPSHGQSAWHWQNPLPQGNYLYDICFVDSIRGWAVGHAGTVLRTTDGGSHWQYIQTQFNDLFSSLSFISPAKGWLMTYYQPNKILRTTDEGLSWDSLTSLSSSSSYDIVFVSDSVGFVSGNNGVLRTSNGGRSWSAASGTAGYGIYSIHFSTPTIGWATAFPGRAFKTIDGGQTWTNLYAGGLEASPRSVYSKSNQFAWIVGSHYFMGTITGFLYSTANGGATWQSKYFEQTLTDVYFASPDTGWVSDADGIVHFTTDGGVNWRALQGRALKFAFGSRKKAWGIFYSSGIIAGTNDGWESSRLQTPSVTTQILSSVSAFDSNNVVACGLRSLIIGTTDGGKNWRQYYDPGSSTYLNDIVMRSPTRIWAVGQGGTIVRSTDGGNTWVSTNLGAVRLSGITFVNDSIGIVVGNDGSGGLVYRSTDGGKTWSLAVALSQSAYLDKIAFSRPSLGWIAADDFIFRSTDLGMSWQAVNSTTFAFVDVAAEGDYACFGLVNNVVYTTNAGATWTTTRVFPLSNSIYTVGSLAFIDERNGWAASNSGIIYRTTDGGGNWQEETRINRNSLWSLRFAQPNKGWAVGAGGAILHYDGVITSVHAETHEAYPDRSLLFQNYPNPFNPTTRIEYSLPKTSHVSLKVFDMMGREVATLVEGVQEAGFKTVEFDAEGLASGVYFYRLQSGSFGEAKKLIVIR